MNIKKLLAVLLVALLTLSVFGCGNKEDEKDDDDDANITENNIYQNFTYGVSGEGTYEITGFVYSGTDLIDITIPATISEREVTGIAKDAFKAVKTIKSVTLPAGMTYIGDYAFYDCDNLTSITIPDSVTEIGVGAFRNCDKLATAVLSSGLKEINDYAFMECPVLKGVTIPAGVTVIGNGAFYGCVAIEEITLPEVLTDLGDTAFYGCTALKKATVLSTVLGVNVERPIDEELPMDEDNIEIVEHKIGDYAFGNCDPDSTGKSQTVFTVTEDSAFAKYAEERGYTLNIQ